MEILEAFDLTRCAFSAAQLSGCDPKTVQKYVDRREAGLAPEETARQPRLIDHLLLKVAELPDHSKGRIRADVVHQRLVAMGCTGTDRSTRRAVAEVTAAWKNGHRRRYRPWTPEPGMRLQLDWGEGPKVASGRTHLFCAWLPWYHFRVAIPAWDQTLGTLAACWTPPRDASAGSPSTCCPTTHTPSPSTASLRTRSATRRFAAAGKHYGSTVATCEPFDPESKGGVEATVKIAKGGPGAQNRQPQVRVRLVRRARRLLRAGQRPPTPLHQDRPGAAVGRRA
ncbi:hypothetical protein [Streptomyces chartreusis]|uniref:hypothetical protein n=1 Tax=Streptomyces chartreusis TaxID=1969 RepID=UPI0037D48E6D